MIACICTNTSEDKIKEILSQENGEYILKEIGIGQCCGSCLDNVESLITANSIKCESND